jgi:hypothetical protein
MPGRNMVQEGENTAKKKKRRSKHIGNNSSPSFGKE